MKSALAILFLAFTGGALAQRMTIFTVEGDAIPVSLVEEPMKLKLLEDFQGVQDNTMRKQWTARTYRLANGKLLVEFYDKQAALIENESDFERLEQIRFLKNHIWNLKKDISYKIELPFEKAVALSQSKRAKKLEKYKSSMPDKFGFEVYELETHQLLFIDHSKNNKSATLYKDLKTLASENREIEERAYGIEDDEFYMKELAKGEPLMDFDPNEHLIYPKYLEDIIQSHQLILMDSKVQVANYWGNLYQSKNGYWVLIDDENQPNGAREKMTILTLRIYEDLNQFRKAQNAFQKLEKEGIKYEHFSKDISDKYGESFPEFVDSLINVLPAILNIDAEQLAFDENGIAIVDEAIRWNHPRWYSLNDWFPSVLAYYGKFYIQQKGAGKWVSKYDKENKVWIPQVSLPDGTAAFDIRSFWKDLYEWPIPLKWAGRFDEKR